MVIENLKSIIGYSSNSLPKDFAKLLSSLKENSNKFCLFIINYEQLLSMSAKAFVKPLNEK